MRSLTTLALLLLLGLAPLAAQATSPWPVPPGTPRPTQAEPWGPAVLPGPFQAQEVFRSHPAIYATGPRLEILVNEFLYPQVRSALLTYVERLEWEGWGVAVVAASGGRDTDLKAFLQRRHQADRIQGAFLIGELPVAWFEMGDDFFLKRAVFPCDFYFMDLDGTWIDQDQDGLWDGHAPSASGDERPELFLGRLTAAPFADALRSEAEWVRAYLAKAAGWRTIRPDPPNRALSYQDDPWAHLGTGQGAAFSQVVSVTDPLETTAAGYLAELARGYRSVVLCASSDEQGHTFESPGLPPSRVQAADILGSPGDFPIVNLFAARAGDFTAPRYIGGAYVLAARGAVSVVASTKIGAMTEWDGFYQALGQGASAGGAFKEWLAQRYPYGREQVRWYYGLTLLGDPTLIHLGRQALTANRPSLPPNGGTIEFDLDCGVAHARHGYLMLATGSGTSPGEVLAGFRLPLNLDAFTSAFLGVLNTPIFQGAYGQLDATGRAKPRLTWNRPLAPELQGLQLHFAALPLVQVPLTLLGAVGPVSLGLAGEVGLVEDFASTAMCDLGRSGAPWGGGKLLPGLVGGSGVLGDFDPAVGSSVAGSGPGQVFVFSTDNTLIPGDRTLDGKSRRVIDGRFEFANFVLPAGVSVRFEGTQPARIHVRGKVEIHGTLDLSGQAPTVVATLNQVLGERGAPGGRPGAGGGAGGDGGNEPGQGLPQGLDGKDIPVPAGHPRKGTEVGTRGRGSAEHPLGLDPQAVTYDYFQILTIQHSAPGGGGGGRTAGGLGSIVMLHAANPVHGQPVPPSGAFPFLPILGAPQVLEQVVLGGAGGGGVGTSCYGSMFRSALVWSFGNGGGGGGGALALRAGGNLLVSTSGAILTAGAAGGGPGKVASLAPGGGGGGGALLLQTGGTPTLLGALDLAGGPALGNTDLYSTSRLTSAAGGHGFLRVEAVPAPSLGSLGNVKPAPAAENVGLLTDRDKLTGAMSLWHLTGMDRPFFTRFVIEALVNGQPTVFSDLSNPPVSGKPVIFYLQGARLDGPGQVIEGSRTGWFARTADLMAAQATVEPRLKANAVRWVILLDPGVATGPVPATLEVNKVSVYHAL